MPGVYLFIIITWLYLMMPANIWAQVKIADKSKKSIEIFYRMQDSLWVRQLPQLKLPETFRNIELPTIVDNSQQPYMRPVFSQMPYANCGQASSIGYAFTYEINRLRDLPADTSLNQYPPDFVWNFLGDVQGGVSYYHTFSIMEKCGSPTVTQYGGFQVDDIQWMSGYDKYLAAMKNRIGKVMSIDISTIEGITILKHWLFHHLEDSDVGGVAVFSASSPWNTVILPEGTPEEGKIAIAEWRVAYHNMTIVGYNDSIRFDYNGDGRYTNDIDLNGDSILNVRDWEIGGVKIINSYGIDSHDSGYFYAMYKSLADPYNNVQYQGGGIWNNMVVVMEVKEDYEPILTLRAKIRHDTRQAIEISAGISSDTNYQIPIHRIDFPIFNYQGDDLPMQGFTDTIEFGLDITPLLAYINKDRYARIFLQIDEIDEGDVYSGEVLSMDIFDYIGDQHFKPGNSQVRDIINNGTTYVSQVKEITFQKPVIDQDSIPVYTVNQEYEFDFTASNGIPPFKWSVIHQYQESLESNTFPVGLGNKIPIEDFGDSDAGKIPIPLPFSFPYYGINFDTIWIHVDGFVKFEKSDAPWPYFIDKDLQIKSVRMIAPMFTDLYIRGENGIWIDQSDSTFFIRWKAEGYFKEEVYGSEFNFALKISENGTIEFYYGETYSSLKESWASGISDGGNQSYQVTEISNQFPIFPNQKVSLHPPIIPNDLMISEDGHFSCYPLENRNYKLHVQATDQNWIAVSKEISFSNTIQIDYQTTIGGLVDDKSLAYVDIRVWNHSETAINDALVNFKLHSQQADIIDSTFFIGQLDPLGSISIDSAFSFLYSPSDNTDYTIPGSILLANDTILTRTAYYFQNESVKINVELSAVEDGNNGNLESDETGFLVFNIVNQAAHTIENLSCEFISEDPYLNLLDNVQQNINEIKPYSSQEVQYKVRLNKKTPNGYIVKLGINLVSEKLSGIHELNLPVNSAKKEIAIAYFNSKQREASANLKNLLKENSFDSDLITNLSPIENYNYKLVIVNLGSYPFNSQLSDEQSLKLVSYLDNGGNLMMQGGSTFFDDPQKPIQDYFNVDASYESWLSDLDSLKGMSETFTENMIYKYNGPKSKIDYLEPLDGAFMIIEEPATEFGFAVAYDQGDYKTIASTVDLAAVSGLNEASSGKKLIMEILGFFEINTRLTANFFTEQISICDKDEVQYFNLSSTTADELLWQFEEGIPEYSSENNPIVSYMEPGLYGVSLIAKNDNESDTLIIEQYINVQNCSSVDESHLSLVIYPNPTSNFVNLIYHPKSNKDLKLSLINIHGRIMMSERLADIPAVVYKSFDLSELPKGIYFLVIEEKSNRSIHKILVK